MEETATYLSKCPETVRRWARAGKLAGWLTPDGSWRFYPADVQSILRPGNRAARNRPPVSEDESVVRARLDMAFAKVQQRRTGT